MLSTSRQMGQTLSRPATIEQLDVVEAAAILPELQNLLDGSYHDSHMYRDLAEDVAQAPNPFQLFLARSSEVVGVAVVESKVHPAFNYLEFPPVHVKRFTVAEAVRGMGIGKQLLDASKHYCFEELGLQALFGESNEKGAISMYGREGALYSKDATREYWRRNTPEESLTYFAMDITDPLRRGERYPNGEGIRFVFCKDDETTQLFRALGHISKPELLSLVEEQ